MRRVAIFQQVQNPPRCQRVEDLGTALKGWLSKKRQNEMFTDRNGRPCQASDDSLVAAMFPLMPKSLEENVMFANEDEGFQELYDKLLAYSSTKQSIQMSENKTARKDDPMDVHASSKGKSKGKGKKGSYCVSWDYGISNGRCQDEWESWDYGPYKGRGIVPSGFDAPGLIRKMCQIVLFQHDLIGSAWISERCRTSRHRILNVFQYLRTHWHLYFLSDFITHSSCRQGRNHRPFDKEQTFLVQLRVATFRLGLVQKEQCASICTKITPVPLLSETAKRQDWFLHCTRGEKYSDCSSFWNRLGHKKLCLKSDGEPALVAIQEEVRRQRKKTTKNQKKIKKIKITANPQKGDEGRTAYHRLRGKSWNHEMVAFGEKVHYRINRKTLTKEYKLDGRWCEGYFMGVKWRTGESGIATSGGICKASAIRRVGGHRRWDAEGLLQVKGVPWDHAQKDADPGEVRVVVAETCQTEQRGLPQVRIH